MEGFKMKVNYIGFRDFWDKHPKDSLDLAILLEDGTVMEHCHNINFFVPGYQNPNIWCRPVGDKMICLYPMDNRLPMNRIAKAWIPWREYRDRMAAAARRGEQVKFYIKEEGEL